MYTEFLLLVLVLGTALLACGWLAKRVLPLRYSLYVWAGLALLFALLLWHADTLLVLSESEPLLVNRPIAVAANDYVTSNECKSCHPGKHASWYATYHRTMTQVAGPETVAADFSGEAVVFDGVEFRPFRVEDKFFIASVDLASANGEREEIVREVSMLTGSHNYQVYWYEAERPRQLGQIPIVYFIEEKKWIPRLAAFVTPYEDIRNHDETGRWNDGCIICHTTNGRQENYSVAADASSSDTYDTRASEFGIACESCHGPGRAHVSHYRNPIRRYVAHLFEKERYAIVNPAKLSAKLSVHVCGQCHAVQDIRADWKVKGTVFRPGDTLDSDRRLVEGDFDLGVIPTAEQVEKLRSYYWKDGVVRVRGRELHDVMRSPCFESDRYSCLTCHSLHKGADDNRSDRDWANDLLRPSAVDAAVCQECHQEFTAAKEVAEHTFHAPSSAGSECYNCHMPFTNIGFLRAIRNHRVTVPSAQVSLDTGRPLACNQCHLDRSLAWSASWLSDRYGQAAVEVPPEHKGTAASLVWLWSGDAGQRALAAWSMGWSTALEVSGTGWQVPHLAEALRDDYPAVRQIALRSLQANPQFHGEAFDPFAEKAVRNLKVTELLASWQEQFGDQLPEETPGPLMLESGPQVETERRRQLLGIRDPNALTLNE